MYEYDDDVMGWFGLYNRLHCEILCAPTAAASCVPDLTHSKRPTFWRLINCHVSQHFAALTQTGPLNFTAFKLLQMQPGWRRACRVNKVGRIRFSVSKTNVVRFGVKVKVKVMVIVLRSIKPWRIGRVKIANNNQAITFRKHSHITSKTTNSAPQKPIIDNFLTLLKCLGTQFHTNLYNVRRIRPNSACTKFLLFSLWQVCGSTTRLLFYSVNWRFSFKAYMMHTQRSGALFHFINIQMEITLNWSYDLMALYRSVYYYYCYYF